MSLNDGLDTTGTPDLSSAFSPFSQPKPADKAYENIQNLCTELKEIALETGENIIKASTLVKEAIATGQISQEDALEEAQRIKEQVKLLKEIQATIATTGQDLENEGYPAGTCSLDQGMKLQ